MFHIKTGFCAILAFSGSLALTGCDNDSDPIASTTPENPDTPEATETGVAQKGPFRAGGTAEAIILANDGTTGNQQLDGTIAENGQYQFEEIPWTGPTLLRMQGEYFDETAANFSTSSRTLEAVIRVLESTPPNANVNLFTHFTAARTRSLMAGGTDFDSALTQARSDAQAAFGLSSAPADLNLLNARDELESDSANLLLFSAASLDADIGQAGLDTLAADFADDGRINGDGADELAAINDAGSDELLENARLALQNQYGVTPPNAAGGGGFAWLLDACTAAKLDNPRVFCENTTFRGDHLDDSGEFVIFVPLVKGHYTIELFGDNSVDDDNTGSCRWTVYSEPDLNASELGDSDADGFFCGVEDVTTFRLDANEKYYVRPVVEKDDENGPVARFTLNATRVSEGSESTTAAREIPINQKVDATVGRLIQTSDESFYRFTVGQGKYTITATDFPCGTDNGGLRLELYEDGFSNQIARDWEEGKCNQTIETSLDAGEYYLKVINFLPGFNRDSFRPSPGQVDYTLEVNSQ
ncbi:hypothetical protein [uncultured Marinobacter sp.]|uniref:hypothetical protein n=1 Tax=uncultured Marinobacter sp. TaxID=187379 RepID=UPI0025D7D456|nr:hypothetical protein [uncultured Marinobacter sp.]